MAWVPQRHLDVPPLVFNPICRWSTVVEGGDSSLELNVNGNRLRGKVYLERRLESSRVASLIVARST
jgi:hypothetical protein